MRVTSDSSLLPMSLPPYFVGPARARQQQQQQQHQQQHQQHQQQYSPYPSPNIQHHQHSYGYPQPQPQPRPRAAPLFSRYPGIAAQYRGSPRPPHPLHHGGGGGGGGRGIPPQQDYPKGGHDIALFKHPEKVTELSLACPICTDVVRDACEADRCGHIFCSSCIRHALSFQQQCPLDNLPLQWANMRRSMFVQRTVNNMKVRCPHASKADDCDPADTDSSGCQWEGTLGSLDEHVRDCVFRTVTCEACQQQLQARQLAAHATGDCPRRLVVCELCDQQLPADEVDAHVENDCPAFEVACTNDGCGLSFQRQHLQRHLELECQHALVDCPFVKYGCTVRHAALPDLEEHMAESAERHSTLMEQTLLATVGTLRNLYARSQANLNQARRQLGHNALPIEDVTPESVRLSPSFDRSCISIKTTPLLQAPKRPSLPRPPAEQDDGPQPQPAVRKPFLPSLGNRYRAPAAYQRSRVTMLSHLDPMLPVQQDEAHGFVPLQPPEREDVSPS